MRKWLALLLIPLLTISLGALVDYLSNTLTFQAEVKSPIEISNLTAPDTISAGDTTSINYTTINHANNAVDGVHRLTITPPEGSQLTGEEIDDVTFTYGETEYPMCTETQTENCVNVVAADGVITLYSPTITHEAGSSVNTKFTITWDPATEPGTYGFEAQVIVPE